MIAQVVSGQLTPEEAEKQAALLGLKAIEYRPDPLLYDPMKEQFWTLPMAVAWIAYRTAEAVRENWPAYRLECVHWLYSDQLKSPGRSGFDLFHFAPVNLRRLQMAEKLNEPLPLNPPSPMSIAEAIDALWQALRGSCFEASGIELASGKRETIDALRLQDLRFGEIDHHDVLRVRAPIGIGAVRYRDITVPMRGVRGLWGVHPPATPRMGLPNLVRPDGPGFMPLFCAAQ